jgi:hypothetical protein
MKKLSVLIISFLIAVSCFAQTYIKASKVDVNQTATGTTASVAGAADTRVLAVKSTSAATGSVLTGLFETQQTVATTGGPQGLEGYIYTNNPTGAVVLGIGTIGNVHHNGAGTLSYGRAIQGGGVLSGNGTITDMSGLFSTFAITGSGTIGTYYGAYLEAPTSGGGTITNRYGLYSADGNAVNYFAGKVGIGGAPTAALDVWSGNVFGFQLGADNAGTSRTNNTTKVGSIVIPHYAIAQPGVQALLGSITSGANQIILGGGSGSTNAATKVSIYTGATTTTGTGTERWYVDSSGKIFMTATPTNSQTIYTLLSRDNASSGEFKTFTLSSFAATVLDDASALTARGTLDIEEDNTSQSLTGVTNAFTLSSTGASWVRSGNQCTMSGSFTVIPSTATLCEIGIAPPNAVTLANFTAASEGAGTGTANTSSEYLPVKIIATAGQAYLKASFIPASAGATYTVTYSVTFLVN